MQPADHTLSLSPAPKRALCYGQDMVLLLSRQRILQLAGCPSDYSSTEGQFRASLHTLCPALIILCHTLPLEQGVAAATLAQQLCPSAPMLLLYVQYQRFIPTQPHTWFQVGEGPGAFAHTVFHLLYDSSLCLPSS